jgi:hypothetical protein
VRDVADLARTWLHANHRSRLVLPIRLPGRLASAFRNGWNCVPDRADGSITFEDFVRSQATADVP